MSHNVNGTDHTIRPWTMQGPSIQMDPLFPYYADRSAESVAEEIERAGYRTVHYFVVQENKIHTRIIDALQRRDIAVWAMVLGNGAFGVSHLPPQWSNWRMELLREPKDGFQRLSHFAKEYVEWKKAAATRLVTEIAFDGFEVAEPYFPEWNGLYSGIYGDVGLHAQRAFKERYGTEMPEFRNRWAANYYRRVPQLYRCWIEFRVDAVNGLIDELVNGPGGVREARPDIRIATWSLAVRDRRGLAPAKLREWQGIDAVEMIRKVRPDMHILQTHWPDWMRPKLPPDYIAEYWRFADPIRAAFPGLPLGVQADIGSLERMVKGRDWLTAFSSSVHKHGYDAWTAYEYHLGGYMYDEPPVPVKSDRSGEDELVITFSKRIAPTGPESIEVYMIKADGARKAIRLKTAETDGNRLFLQVESLPLEAFELQVQGIRDTPELWLFKDRIGQLTPAGCTVRVKAR
ncbi:N-acyl-D-glucosamine 2-epimerase [Paenibacillus sp. P96]|uniref:N-acyl-D-glucosamine 2-epimerase n=1 Tax=Paenibacillus zeirhizosphaerae TaxID=2987519 RepID=A0ABT9FWQ2_9BACL|nr:N-acyl-D-glucosamine 2-epimerase [Paenibacillus sp. P96]MDP4099050.1 N-acyl-D-glucosamine 2-epimerase [Paenibacillus sp. P96]